MGATTEDIPLRWMVGSLVLLAAAATWTLFGGLTVG